MHRVAKLEIERNKGMKMPSAGLNETFVANTTGYNGF